MKYTYVGKADSLDSMIPNAKSPGREFSRELSAKLDSFSNPNDVKAPVLLPATVAMNRAEHLGDHKETAFSYSKHPLEMPKPQMGGSEVVTEPARELRKPEPLASGRRQRHIMSEQRRRNQAREAFQQLSELLAIGRTYGARALGLNSGAGTGVEDEELDDRTDTEEDLLLCCDEEELQRRKRNAQRRARSRAVTGKQTRGKGRGRGGSAGHAGSKSAVLFQVIDLIDWLDGREKHLRRDIEVLEAHLELLGPQAKRTRLM